MLQDVNLAAVYVLPKKPRAPQPLFRYRTLLHACMRCCRRTRAELKRKHLKNIFCKLTYNSGTPSEHYKLRRKYLITSFIVTPHSPLSQPLPSHFDPHILPVQPSGGLIPQTTIPQTTIITCRRCSPWLPNTQWTPASCNTRLKIDLPSTPPGR